MSTQYHFARTELANSMADILAGPNPLGLASDGLFIGGERRIGKTAFLLNDLIPILQQRGVEVIYLDLMQDAHATPAQQIAYAFTKAAERAKSSASKLAKKLTPAGLSANVFGVGAGINFNEQGSADSMVQEFEKLAARVQRPVVLIIDEAQRALDTPEGQAALWALKSTRDQIKNSAKTKAKLSLVFTGSNRAKLSDMVTKKSEAFFGSQVMPMPYLGKDYIDDLCANVNRLLAGAALETTATLALFEQMGNRPALLNAAITSCMLSNAGNDTLNQRLAIAAKAQIDQETLDLHRQFANLPILAQCVLVDIASNTEAAPVYSESSIKRYGKMTKRNNLNTASVQAAIEVLVNAGLVWKSARGVYRLEEPNQAVVLRGLEPKER